MTDLTAGGTSGLVTGVTTTGGSTLLSVRRPGGEQLVTVPAVPDRAAARRATAALRSVSWLRIELTGGGFTCRVSGCTRRPVSARIGLAAALGLVAAGVPTVVVGEAA